MTDSRRPDSTTDFLLEDQKSSGLSLGKYEREHSIIFEELPLPSPATQRIRRHESRTGRRRGSFRAAAREPKPEGEMTPEMAAARAAYYAGERLMGSPVPCAGCGGWVTNDVTRTDLLCDSCAFLAQEEGRAIGPS